MKRFALSVLVILAGTLASAQTMPQQSVVGATAAFANRSRPQPAHLAAIRSISDATGSRLIVTSDVTLTDYQAYQNGGRFFLLIPYSTEPKIQNELRGRGFTDAVIERRGEDVLLSFALEAGARAHVSQRFNRLEVLFSAGNESSASVQEGSISATATPTATPTPAPTPSASPSSSPSTVETNSSLEATKEATTPLTTPASPQKPGVSPTAAVTVSGITLPAEKANPIHVSKFEKPPVIDGKLDDEVWKTAIVLKDFYQISPGDNTAPSRKTEVMVGYDAKFLYFGFHCFDEPDKVRATVAKRDEVFGEDNVRMYLDTFNDQRRAYLLGFNPLGVQQDGIYTESQGTDYSVDIVMESKGTITSDGYAVEVAIPFKSLRYTAGKGKLWGIHVWRNIDRFNDEIDSWVPISRDKSGTLNQEAHLTGLEGISTERTIELIPSLTISETGKRVRTLSNSQLDAASRAGINLTDPGHFVNQPVKPDPGLTAKWGITPTVTLDLAINPDFAQVEADATVSTANQRFPIFFDEKRPFFLEGKDIFTTQIAAVHTRTIIDPDFAAKLTGKLGRNTFGLLVASDNAPGDFTNEQRFDPDALPVAGERLIGKNAKIGVLRLKRDIGKENSLGFLATAYSFVNRSNYLGGFDGRFRFNKITTIDFQVLGSNARRCSLGLVKEDDQCQTLNGFIYAYNFNQNRRHLSINFNGAGRTEGYRSDVGFNRRRNTNNHNSNIDYTTEPHPKKTLVSWNVYNYLGGNFDWQGRMQNWNDEFQTGPNLQRQTFIRIGYNWGYERVFPYEFGVDSFARGRSQDSIRSRNPFIYIGSTPSKKYTFFYFIAYRWGEHDFDFGAGPNYPRVSPAALLDPNAPLDPGKGNLFYTNGNVTYKATNDLNMTFSFNKNRLTRRDTRRVAFDENIFSLRTTYQFTRFTFARARIDYDTLVSNIRGQFLLGWTPNPGTAFYVGYNDDLNRSFFNPFTGQLEPGFRRNGRTFFVKMAYLFRKSF
ncbi:MAG TPA: DUF5916 domain-containing protein [Pyrinomonadaceae bacterium]|jgi:hypothetical protein|nr:DUF5916 domain-containing protein [Pyrinomonadaceae bacterium]